MPKKTNTLAHKLTPEVISDLKNRTLKHLDLAKELKVSPTHLSRTLAEHNFKRTPSPLVAERKQTSLLYHAKAKNRQSLAEKVINKILDLETAQNLAGCSERTMRRYIAKLK